MLAIAAAGNDAADDDDAANEDNAAADEAAGSAAEAHPVPHSPPVSPVRELITGKRLPTLDFVAPDLRKQFSLSPTRPDNYIEPADFDNLVSMEDEPPCHGGFHEVLGRTRLIRKEAGNSKENHGGSYFDTCISERNARGGGSSLEVRGGLSSCQDRVSYLQLCSIHDTLSADVLPQAAILGICGGGKAPMPELDIPAEFLAEDAQARQRLEEEQASERLVQRLRAEDLAKEDLPNVSEERAKELDDLMMRMTETDWLNLMMQVGSNPALARELLGADVTEANFVERMTAIKEKKKRALADLRYRALKGKPMQQSEVTQMMRNLVKNQRLEKDCLLSAQYNLFRPKPVISKPPSKRQRVDSDTLQPSGVPAASTQHADDPDSAGGGSFKPVGLATPMAGFAVPDTAGGTLGTNVTASTIPTSAAMDSAGSHHESGVSPFADSADSSSPSPVSTDHIPIDVLFESTSRGINEFFLDSDEDEQIGMSRVAADPDSDDEVLAEIIFRGQSISGHGVVVVDKLLMMRLLDPRVKVENIYDSFSSPHRSVVNIVGRTDGEDLWRDVNLLCQSLHSDDVEDFWRTQDEWIVSSWKLYPKSSVHVLDLTNGKTVLTVPPSYCRDVVVAGSVIQTVQAGLRESYECLASAPIACTARQMVFSSPWLTAKKESGSPLQTALVCFSNPLIALASPEQTATGKDVSNPLYGCDGLPKTVRVFQFTLDSRSEKLDWLLLHQDWKLLFFDVAASFDSAVHRVHAVSFDAAVASTVSAACIVAAGYIVSAGFMMLLLTLFLLLLNPLASRRSI
ncbi:hypothetical protein Tco_0348179 [Tanacetum coccineum]